MSASTRHVAILGCGVIGLSTALAILEDQQDSPHGHRTLVTIISKEVPNIDLADVDVGRAVGKPASTWPSKKHTAEYASVWAGAHHVSDAKSERELRHDKITFERMSRLARERPWASSTSQKPTYSAPPVVPIDAKGSKKVQHKDAEPLVWVDQTELFETSPGAHSSAAPPYQGVLDWYPDFKPLPSSSLPQGLACGCTFSTLDINVPVYHRWLLRRFIELGGRLVVAQAKSIRDAIRLVSATSTPTEICKSPASWEKVRKVDAMVTSPGLGARTIEGINDEAMHPQRGQVVVVNAPWLSTSSTLQACSARPRHGIPGVSVVRPQGGREVYIIPRGDGTVICGGTRIINDWDPNPRPETTKKILERCLALVPQLANPRKSTGLVRPRVEDVDVVEVNVGLRPARRGGVRLERAEEDVDGVKIIHNYGYGGAGYQASWGAALDAKQLVEAALSETSSALTALVPPSKL